jgi:hypothetical protein
VLAATARGAKMVVMTLGCGVITCLPPAAAIRPMIAGGLRWAFVRIYGSMLAISMQMRNESRQNIRGCGAANGLVGFRGGRCDQQLRGSGRVWAMRSTAAPNDVEGCRAAASLQSVRCIGLVQFFYGP